MIAPKPETVVPLLSVSAWKHRELVACETAIILAALKHKTLWPGSVEVSLEQVPKESRAGVLSNGWNAVRCAGIIERAPMGYCNPDLDIYGGRIKNPNPAAKSRWVAVYFLVSESRAREWLKRHGVVEQPAERQEEMAL